MNCAFGPVETKALFKEIEKKFSLLRNVRRSTPRQGGQKSKSIIGAATLELLGKHHHWQHVDNISSLDFEEE